MGLRQRNKLSLSAGDRFMLEQEQCGETNVSYPRVVVTERSARIGCLEITIEAFTKLELEWAKFRQNRELVIQQ